MYRKTILFLLALLPVGIYAHVNYSIVKVNEEACINCTMITTDNDNVCMPEVWRSDCSINRLSNRILDILFDGSQLEYMSFRKNTTNIIIMDFGKQWASVQRTSRQAVFDFTYLPNRKNIYFSEVNGKMKQIFLTSGRSDYKTRMNLSQQYQNTNLFACHTNGTQLVQLTFHAADDIIPIWSWDGRSISFISQRGSLVASANI